MIFRNPFPSGVEALEQFMNRWNYPTKVHFVADAAFGTTSLMEKVNEKVDKIIIINIILMIK